MASFGVDDPSFLPSLSLRATTERAGWRAGERGWSTKLIKSRARPFRNERTNEPTSERAGETGTTDGDGGFVIQKMISPSASVRSLSPSSHTPIPAASDSPWPPPRGSTVRPLDGAVMPVHDAWDFLRLFEGRVQLSLSSRFAGMLLDDGGGVGHSHLWSWSLQKGSKMNTRFFCPPTFVKPLISILGR